jgi:tripartite-type tricarboxylate transporter receptor subunit TctC
MIRSSWLIVAAVVLSALSPAQAQTDFPRKAVTVVVPFPPGGVTDIIARGLSRELQQITGQPFPVDNKAGATGIVGANFVKAAPPDGYTIMVGTTSQMGVLPALMPNPPFDPAADFTPIALLGTTPYFLLLNPNVSAGSLAELIALIKASPGKFNYASAGIGSFPHLLGEMFKQMAKVDMAHVPYKGNSPGTTAALSGEVQMTFDTAISAMSYIRAGKLRAVGVTADNPSAVLPDVPPIATVLPGYGGEAWLCLYAPAKTPAPIVARLRAIVEQAIHQPQFVKNAAAGGFEAPKVAPDGLRAFLTSDLLRWRTVGRAAKVVLE